MWEHKHPLFICVCFGSLTYLHLMIITCLLSSSFPSFLLSALHLFPTTLPNPPSTLVGAQSPSKQTEWTAFCACSGLCGFSGDQAMVGMKGNETWLCVRWAARGQLSNVLGFGLETWETQREREREKKSPPSLFWLNIHRSGMSLSQGAL